MSDRYVGNNKEHTSRVMIIRILSSLEYCKFVSLTSELLLGIAERFRLLILLVKKNLERFNVEIRTVGTNFNISYSAIAEPRYAVDYYTDETLAHLCGTLGILCY